MEKIILQKDDTCGECGSELPKGSSAYSDGFDNLRCIDCYDNDYLGENYG
jgi:hypothetical protein